jgi:hypothetical protein
MWPKWRREPAWATYRSARIRRLERTDFCALVVSSSDTVVAVSPATLKERLPRSLRSARNSSVARHVPAPRQLMRTRSRPPLMRGRPFSTSKGGAAGVCATLIAGATGASGFDASDVSGTSIGGTGEGGKDTLQVRVAGVGSAFPAGSVAIPSNTCDPGASWS